MRGAKGPGRAAQAARRAGATCALLLGLAAAAGCGASGESLLLGTGVSELVPLGTGDAVDVFMGPQGGIHLFASVRASGIEPGDPALPIDDPGQPEVHYVVTRVADGAVLADFVQSAPFSAAADAPGAFDLVGVAVRLFLPEVDPPTPADVAGESLDLAVVVTDASGQSVDASVEVVAREGL